MAIILDTSVLAVPSTTSGSSLPQSFDAVEMSRRLREETSRILNAMSREERLTHLRETRERFSCNIKVLFPEHRTPLRFDLIRCDFGQFRPKGSGAPLSGSIDNF